jgi:hypothetical protein
VQPEPDTLLQQSMISADQPVHQKHPRSRSGPVIAAWPTMVYSEPLFQHEVLPGCHSEGLQLARHFGTRAESLATRGRNQKTGASLTARIFILDSRMQAAFSWHVWTQPHANYWVPTPSFYRLAVLKLTGPSRNCKADRQVKSWLGIKSVANGKRAGQLPSRTLQHDPAFSWASPSEGVLIMAPFLHVVYQPTSSRPAVE